MYLYEDKIILTFNYKDGSKTITLAEVEGSDLSVLGAGIEKPPKPLFYKVLGLFVVWRLKGLARLLFAMYCNLIVTGLPVVNYCGNGIVKFSGVVSHWV